MSKTDTNSLTPYQRAATEWFLWRPGLVSCTVNFDQAKKPDKIDRWLIANVPHYARVFCEAMKIPVRGIGQICRVTNCGRCVENPTLGDICNRCLEEITAGEEDRGPVLREAVERHDQENLHDEKEDR